MSTRQPAASTPAMPATPARADAALRQVIDLLDLVRREEAVLRRLTACTADLQAIHQARGALLAVTDAELAEARATIDGPNHDHRLAGQPLAGPRRSEMRS